MLLHQAQAQCAVALTEIKKGYLRKRGAIRKSWKERYFVLTRCVDGPDGTGPDRTLSFPLPPSSISLSLSLSVIHIIRARSLSLCRSLSLSLSLSVIHIIRARSLSLSLSLSFSLSLSHYSLGVVVYSSAV